MLSYMLPFEGKPPGHVDLAQLELEEEQGAVSEMAPMMIQGFIAMEQQAGAACNGRRGARPPGKVVPSAISTESSASSLSSDVISTTPTSGDRLKPKLVQNGASKATSLKRVSFGSSKGSMVETLIYESPLQEEPEGATPTAEEPSPFPTDSDAGPESKNPSTKVRVTFFESERPHVVNSPEPGDGPVDSLDALVIMTSTSPSSTLAPQYNRQASTDSGWDNPFRPDGDLSREADEIVERIKEGKPITPTPGNGASQGHSEVDGQLVAKATTIAASSPSKGSNGTANCKAASPGAVDVQRTVVSPTNGEPEHVVIKKKPKCKCCVIQ